MRLEDAPVGSLCRWGDGDPLPMPYASFIVVGPSPGCDGDPYPIARYVFILASDGRLRRWRDREVAPT